MNAIIISALMGVLLMFTSIVTSNKQVIKKRGFNSIVIFISWQYCRNL